MTPEEIVSGLVLDSLPHRNYFVQPTSLTSGEGMEEAMKELDRMLTRRRQKNSQ